MIPKFRAWHESEQEMLKDIWFDWQDFENYGSLNEIFRDKRLIFMQSTGLFDKNGVEIFEGSVLTDEGDYGLDSWIFGKVYWDKEELSWLVEWPILNEVHSLAITPYRTVQGNIYDHPELVEVGR